jgi:hypothetical protein
MSWQESAACGPGTIGLFLGPDEEREYGRAVREAAAKKVCTGCPVRPPGTDWLTGRPLSYDVAHQDALVYLDARGRERFLVVGSPNAVGLPSRLRCAASSARKAAPSSAIRTRAPGRRPKRLARSPG